MLGNHIVYIVHITVNNNLNDNVKSSLTGVSNRAPLGLWRQCYLRQQMYDVWTRLSVDDLSCNPCSDSGEADVDAAVFCLDSACNCVYLNNKDTHHYRNSHKLTLSLQCGMEIKCNSGLFQKLTFHFLS